MGLRFLVDGNRHQGYPILDHAPLYSETGYRVGVVDDYILLLRLQRLSAVGPDVFQTVYDPALILRSLEDKIVLGSGLLFLVSRAISLSSSQVSGGLLKLASSRKSLR